MDFCSEKSDVRGLAERLARVNSGIGIKGLVGGACAESGESVRTKICLRAIAGSPRGLPPSWLALADCLCRWLGRAGEVPPVRLPGAVTGVCPPSTRPPPLTPRRWWNCHNPTPRTSFPRRPSPGRRQAFASRARVKSDSPLCLDSLTPPLYGDPGWIEPAWLARPLGVAPLGRPCSLGSTRLQSPRHPSRSGQRPPSRGHRRRRAGHGPLDPLRADPHLRRASGHPPPTSGSRCQPGSACGRFRRLPCGAASSPPGLA